MPFLLRRRGKMAEFCKGRINVEKFGRFTTYAARGDARPGKDQRDSRGAIPERVLASDELLAEVPAVI